MGKLPHTKAYTFQLMGNMDILKFPADCGWYWRENGI